jgi:hypothetical protein
MHRDPVIVVRNIFRVVVPIILIMNIFRVVVRTLLWASLCLL